MLIIRTIPEAIGLMLVGIFLLGTWPAVWHQVEQSGRLPSHTFLDYSFTYLAFAATCALTLGQMGPPATSPLGQFLQFLDQLAQPNWQLVLFALAGGTCLALGDIALQYSLALCGLSVGPPILNSITLILGAVLAYFLDGGINKPQLVFTGAAFAAVAVGLGAAAHVVNHTASRTAAVSAGDSSSGSSNGGQQMARPPEDSAHGCVPGGSKQILTVVTTTTTTLANHSSSTNNGLGSSSSSSDSSSSGRSGTTAPCAPHSRHSSDLHGADAVMTCACDSIQGAAAEVKDCKLGLLHSTPTPNPHTSQQQQQQEQQQQQQAETDGDGGGALSDGFGQPIAVQLAAQTDRKHTADVRQPTHCQQQQQQVLVHHQQQSSITAGRRFSMFVGLAITVVGGIIYGCFMPAFQIAANDPFKLLPAPTPPLSVYTTYFYFAVGFTAVSVAVNACLLYHPPLGIQPSNVTAYLRDNRGRVLSILSGVLAASGDLTQFIGGQTAGYAAAMMVMAYPVVGVLWGLLRFRELRGKPQTGKGCCVSWGLVLVLGQVVLYVLSVGLLSGSAELRAH